MTTQSITSITDGQRKQYKRFVEDAADKVLVEAGIDKDGLQKLIEQGAEFQSRLVTAVRELSVSNQYANEEVPSSCVYPNDYKVNGIAEQVVTIKSLFPELKDATFDEKLAKQPLPPNAEGWFAIPCRQSIAITYGEAVEKVLVKISETRKGKFNNWHEGELGPDYLKQSARTEKMFQKLRDEQKDHDILVVAAQFGLRHRGRSVRRAREVMQVNEVGLGAFAIGIMLLTHPERLMHYDDLYVDCAGDAYASPDADGDFSHAPSFYFADGRLKLRAFWFGDADGSCGSASAFIPQ